MRRAGQSRELLPYAAQDVDFTFAFLTGREMANYVQIDLAIAAAMGPPIAPYLAPSYTNRRGSHLIPTTGRPGRSGSVTPNNINVS